MNEHVFSEVYEAGTSTDEETEKDKAKNVRQLEIIRRKAMNKETTAKRIMKETVTMEDAKKSVTSVSLWKYIQRTFCYTAKPPSENYQVAT